MMKFPDSERHCKDSLCIKETHTSDSLELYILHTIVETSYISLPLTGSTDIMDNRKPILGWTKEVSELKELSKYCYRV